jgi:spore germination protein
MKKLYILILFLFISLVGCTQSKVLDELGLTTLVGYDLGSEDGVTATAVILQVNPELQSNVEVISAEDQTSKGTSAKINRKNSQKIMFGQMRVSLYGEELSKEGIGHYIETLSRNPSMSSSIIMAVVDGQTKSLLGYQYQNIENIGEHIFKLLEQNVKYEHMIPSTLHEVSHDYYSAGTDISMPVIKRNDESVEISGVAIYKRDKMVGQLSAEDSFYVKLIRDNYDSGTFETLIKGDYLPSSLVNNPPDEIPVVLDTIKSKRDLKLTNPKTPEFDLHLTMEARLLEIMPDIDVGKQKNVAELEKAISKSLTSEVSRIIAYCQEVDSDIFGFGESYRSSVRKSKLTDDKWQELYREAKINVQIDFTLVRDGVFE